MRFGVTCALAAMAIAILAAASVPASAKDLPKGGLTAKETADWLKGRGFPVQVLADPTRYGNLMVRSTADGINFQIFFYGCNNDQGPKRRCESIQYSTGWTKSEWVTAERVNAWVREKRYLRAYLGPNGGVWVELDFDVSPGVSYDALNKSLERWRAETNEFRSAMGLR